MHLVGVRVRVRARARAKVSGQGGVRVRGRVRVRSILCTRQKILAFFEFCFTALKLSKARRTRVSS